MKNRDKGRMKEKLKNIGLKMRSKEAVMVMLLCLIGVAGYLNMTIGTQTAPYDETLTTMMELNPEDEEYGQAQMVNSNEVVNKQENDDNAAGDDYFVSARLERENSRSKSLDLLKEIANNEKSDADAKAKAQQSMLEMTSYIDSETNIENMLRAKGFENALAYINESGAVISVKCDGGLNESNVARIQEIVTEQSGVEVGKIKIVEINK